MPRTSSSGNWSDREVVLLIELWGEDGVQAQLEGAKHNKPVYERIAAELAKTGSDKTAEQCRVKMKKLKLDYRKECDKHNKNGQGRSTWRFFDALDTVLGHRPTSQPTVLFDTSAPSIVESDLESLEEGDCNVENKSSESGKLVESPDEIHTSASADPEPLEPGTRKNASNSAVKGKRKRSKEDKIEAIMTSVVNEVINAQQKSDKIYLEHEEKRMKFEAEQRCEERQFQLRMMSMLFGTQNQGTSTPHYTPPPFLPEQYGPYHPFSNRPLPPYDEMP